MSSGLVTVSTTTTQRRSARSTRRLRQAAVESSTTTIPETTTTTTTTTTTPTTTNDHESKATTTSSPSVSATTTATPTATTTTTTNGNGAVRPSDARPINTPKNTTAKSTTKSTSVSASTSTSRSPNNNNNNNSGARPVKPVATPSSATAVPATASAPKPSSVWDRRKLAKAATTPTNATTASKSKPQPKQPPKQAVRGGAPPSRAPSQQQQPSRASAPPSGLAAKSRTGGFRANRTAHRFDSNAAPAPPAAAGATFSANRGGGGGGGATGKKEDFPSLQGGGGGSGGGGDKPSSSGSTKTTTTTTAASANANTNAQTSALRRSGRSGGYQAPRTSHSYDADAVDMTRAAPARPDRIMEQRPAAASPTRTRPERVPERETTVIERPAAPPQTRESGLRREPVDAGGSGGGSRGLSTRSSGFKPRRVTSESAARPSNDVISKLAETFGKGRRKYVPPAIRDVVAAAVTIDSDDDDTPPKREIKPKPKPAPKTTTKSSAAAVASKPAPKPASKPAIKPAAKPVSKPAMKTPTHSRTRVTNKQVSPAKSVHSTTSSYSSSSSSSPKSHARIAKKKKQPFTISGESTKYLEHRQNPHSLASVAIISRDSKSLHDVTSIKTELERKIAATDQEVGNDYYYNKADMVEAVRAVEFDTTIEVTDDAQKIRSNAEAWRPQGPADMATAAALMQGVTVGVGDVYAQDGLATHAHAHAHAMHGYMADPMQPTHGPNMGTNMGTNMAQMAYTEESSPMAPTHSPGLEQQQHQLMLLQQQQMDMFAAGMMPNVPVVTDLREIQKNAAIAMESNLSPTVNEFVPVPASADGMMLQQPPQQMLNQPQFAFNGSFITQQIQNTIPPVNAMNAAFILPANAATGAVGNPQATAWMPQNLPQNPVVNVEQMAQQQQLQAPPQQQQQQQQQLPQAVDGNVGFQAHPQPPPQQQPQQNQNYGFQGYQQQQPQQQQQQQQQRRNRTWNDNNDRNYVGNRGTYRGGGRGTYRGGRGGGNNRYRDYNRNSNNRYQNQYQNSNQTQSNQTQNQNDNTENAAFQQQQQGAQPPQPQQPQQQQMSQQQQQQPQRGGRGGYQNQNQNRNWNSNQQNRGYNQQNQNYRERNFNNNSNGRYGNNNNRRYQRYDAQQQQQPQQGQYQNQHPQQQGQYHGGQSRRERGHKMVDNQSNRYKEYVRETKTTAPAKKYDAKVLPAWCGAEKIEDLFGVIAQDADAGGEEVIVNTQLLDASLYLNFLCDDAMDGVSDAVYECLGLGEIVRSLLPAANHRLKRRIYESAPVFASLSICDATISVDALSVALSPDSFAGVFRYRNPYGLREFRLGQRHSLASVPWPQLQSYLEQCQRLSRIIVGERASGSQEREQQQSEPTAAAQMDGVMQLVSSLVGAQTLIVEQAPFLVDAQFISSLSSVICDLRLFDARIAWSEAFVTAIRNHFGRLSRLGLPANCLDMPTLASVVEGLTEELLLRNLPAQSPSARLLQKQDLLLLFCRFARLEFDASLVAAWPNAAKCKTTKCHTLCVSADTPNFFIPLLMALPRSVAHLAVKNPTGSANNLHFDAEQLRQQKYKTEHVRALTLFGFDNNLKQVANLVNRRLFPALQQLTLVTANSSETIEGDLRKLLKRDIMGDDDDDKDKDQQKKSKTKKKKSKQLEIATICNTDPYFVLA